MTLSWLSPGGINFQIVQAYLGNIDVTTLTSPTATVTYVSEKVGDFLYVCGLFNYYVQPDRTIYNATNLVKINLTTGYADTTFNTLTGTNAAIYHMVIDTEDNTMLISGNFTTYKGTTRQYIAKINLTTAALVTAFDTASGANGPIWHMILDKPNGEVYICGDFTSYKAITRQRLNRIGYTTGGDNASDTFNTTSGAGAIVYHMVLDKPNNALYIVGNFTTYKTIARTRVAKVDATTAALDTTFDSSTGADAFVEGCLLDGSNLYIVGQFQNYKSVGRQRVAKISSTTAALDTTFDTSLGANGNITKVYFNSDNSKLYIIGAFTTYKNTNRYRMALIDPSTGALNSQAFPSNFSGTSFRGLTQVGTDLYISQTAGHPDSSTSLIPGYGSTFRMSASSSTFSNQKVLQGFNASVGNILVDSTHIYCAGDFNYYTNPDGTYVNCNKLAKINKTTGYYDTTFVTSDTGVSFSVNTMIWGPSGSIYVGGNFTTYKGVSALRVAKISSTTAALDTTFNTGTSGYGANGLVQALCYDAAADRLFVGGQFTLWGATGAIRLVKVNGTNAAPILTFDTSLSGVTGTTIYSILHDPANTALYIGGSFTQVKGTARTNIAKVDSDTSALITAFAPNAPNNIVYSLQLDAANSLLYMAGSFTSVGGPTRQGLAQLNSSTGATNVWAGTQGFQTTTTVYQIILSGSSIYACGLFTAYQGTTRQRIAKIGTAAGAVDTTFDTASGARDACFAIALEGSTLYVGGRFTNYKDVSRRGIFACSSSTGAIVTGEL